MKIFHCILVAGFVLLVGKSLNAQVTGNFDSRSLEIEWHLIKNNYENKSGFLSALTFRNNSTQNLLSGGWKMYFNLRYHGYNLSSLNPELKITHVSGELFSIEPAANFSALQAGQSITMEYTGKGRVANYQDVPSGFYWVSDTNPDVAIDLGKVVIVGNASAGTNEKLPSLDATVIYDQNKTIRDIPENQLPKIFPTPKHYQLLKGTFTLDGATTIVPDGSFTAEGDYLARELQLLLGKKPVIIADQKKGKSIFLQKKTLPAEAYQLTVAADRITIMASDGAGIFYGIQSLKSLLPAVVWRSQQGTISVPCVAVSDAPRFAFRAFMLDVARNFQPKQEIIKVLEVMSLYKLNVFHFHLNDDEGWRLEIPGLPELTEVGAKRGYPFSGNQQLHPSYGSGSDGSRSTGSGFYSRADYIEILKYAAERHIRVIPEIESPGHARAAVKAMDARYEKYMRDGKRDEAERYMLHDLQDQSVYLSNQGFRDNVMNVALPSTYRFVEKVIDEIRSMYAEAGAPLTMIHMAGDEVPHGSWERSPAAKALIEKDPSIGSVKDLWSVYFDKVKIILKERGLTLYGWQELVMGTQTADNTAHAINPDYVKDNLQLDAWANQDGNEDIPYKLANIGYRTIITCLDYFYFDLAYADSFDEPGDGWVGFLDIEKIFLFMPFDYYRNARTDLKGKPLPPNYYTGKEKLSEKGKQNIAGIQGALWGENLISTELTEYQLLPKLLPLAEKAWAPEPDWMKETDTVRSQKLYQQAWSVFVNTLGKRELLRLDYYNGGYQYRIATPGASARQGKVTANFQFPGFSIHYTTDGSEPTIKSTVYSTPIADRQIIKIRAFDSRGRGGKTISVTNK